MSRIPWWPASGPIDLATHDLPHAAADTEWWYVNTHVRIADGRTFGLFAAFFRIIADRDEHTGAITYAHSMTWALSDLVGGRYLGESRVDERAPELGLERIKNARGTKDARLNRAMQEVLERGEVPVPDRVIDGAVRVASDRLSLHYGTASFEKGADGSYALRLGHDTAAGCELTFAPRKPCRCGRPRRRRRRPRHQRRADVLLLRPALRRHRLDHDRRRDRGDRRRAGLVRPRVRRLCRAGSNPATATATATAADGEGAGIRDLGWNWTA